MWIYVCIDRVILGNAGVILYHQQSNPEGPRPQVRSSWPNSLHVESLRVQTGPKWPKAGPIFILQVLSILRGLGEGKMDASVQVSAALVDLGVARRL